MLDAKLLRNDIKTVAEQLFAKRGFTLDVATFEKLESERKALQVKVEALQKERNLTAKAIGMAKGKGENADELLKQAGKINEGLAVNEKELALLQDKIKTFFYDIPNLPHASVPAGKSSDDNLEMRRVGNVPKFSFTPLDHVAIGEKFGLMDFERAAKISGARFVVLAGKLAQLHRALIQFMLDIHTKEHGYQEMLVPYLVNEASMYGTGQLPKFRDDQFHVAGEHKFSLIPTAEVPLTNLLRDEILDEKNLPIKYVAHTPCFRSESGSYGKDTRGMIRNHQFEKVELVRFEKPENSYAALEELTGHAETILKRLELPYRVVTLCGGDLGFSAAKTYDLEVWLPSQNCYREISSCSNFEDFQARRLQARFRNAQGKIELLHTLNGSGLAVGRTLVAILENYQDELGNIRIPKALQSYMGGLEVITGGAV